MMLGKSLRMQSKDELFVIPIALILAWVIDAIVAAVERPVFPSVNLLYLQSGSR